MNKPPDPPLNSPERKKVKRVWNQIQEKKISPQDVISVNTNKFLIVEYAGDVDLSKVSPFLIAKTIRNHCGEPKNIKKIEKWDTTD